MEILSNFISIYCYIAFVIGAVLMLVSLSIAAMGKDNESRNKVRFYVARDNDGALYLYMGKPIRKIEQFVACSCGKVLTSSISKFGLIENDYTNLKWEDEPVEVFLNMED